MHLVISIDTTIESVLPPIHKVTDQPSSSSTIPLTDKQMNQAQNIATLTEVMRLCDVTVEWHMSLL